MWLVFFKSGVARPWARGNQRFMIAPRPATASRTYNVDTSTEASRSIALATAERNTFSAILAPLFGAKLKSRCAVSTSFPRIISRT